MPYKSITIGDKFGRLEVICAARAGSGGKSRFVCKCDCGSIKIVRADHLKVGSTKSCGCIHVENLNQRNTKHGYAGTSIYKIYYEMIARCYDKASCNYIYYGARGIRVSEQWIESFENFLKDMGIPDNGMTLDRIDNNDHYCLENCRWTTRKQQSRNRSSNIVIVIDGKRKCLIDWTDHFNLNYGTVYNRLKRGWSVERVFNLSRGDQI